MKTLLILALAAAITTLGLIAFTPDSADAIPPVAAPSIQPRKTMQAFKSEEELQQYLRAITQKKRRRQAQKAAQYSASADAAAPAISAFNYGLAAESVTNVQHAGVDEGGIVKVHGNHLVVLRRGRLFTVAIGDGSLKAISAVDAFGPEIEPQGTWYDEMLVADNTVVVLGYSLLTRRYRSRPL